MADIEGLHVDIDSDIDTRAVHADGLKETAVEAANRVADIARSTAPVNSGAYEAGIQVQETNTGARVFASDYKSAWIEFGVPSRGIPAHFNLRNAAEAAGLKFKKSGG